SFIGEARDKTNFLTWTTANEEDFSHFEIERSTDGRGPWSVLAQPDLQASGIHEYVDQHPLPTAYYRLKLIDLDGTFTYSEVVYLEHHLGANAGDSPAALRDAMKVYPNPSTGRFTVDISPLGLSAEARSKLRLVDLHGRAVWSAPITDNLLETTIDVSEQRSGVYLLVFKDQLGQRFTQRVMVR
ncbi:MAG: T9SS type A sorting domain-containing protein, partial [Bacteroidota bacterium]